eukprot:scaffold6228_cov144-Skeletonema_dohrnii-CCMP3373.AAC.4
MTISSDEDYSLPCFLMTIQQRVTHCFTPISSDDSSRYAHLGNIVSPCPSNTRGKARDIERGARLNSLTLASKSMNVAQ